MKKTTATDATRDALKNVSLTDIKDEYIDKKKLLEENDRTVKVKKIIRNARGNRNNVR